MSRGWGQILGSRVGTYWRIALYTVVWTVISTFAFYVGGVVNGDEIISTKLENVHWTWILGTTGVGSVILAWMIGQVLKPNDAPIEMEIH